MIDRILFRLCLWLLLRRYKVVDIVASRESADGRSGYSMWGNKARSGRIYKAVFLMQADTLADRARGCLIWTQIESMTQAVEKGIPA
jgi:hypothetical protein